MQLQDECVLFPASCGILRCSDLFVMV